MMERRRLDDPDGEEGEEGWTMLFTTPGLRKNFLVMIGTLSVFFKKNIATKLLPIFFLSTLIYTMFDGHLRNIANLVSILYFLFFVSG